MTAAAAGICLLLAGPVAAVPAGAKASPGAGPALLPGWHQTISSPGPDDQLDGVFCTSATNCWSVGHVAAVGGAALNVALHWNGRFWSQAATPDPGGTASGDFNGLFGVSCASAADCWAVGFVRAAGGPRLNQALHWNGRHWSTTTVPDPGGTATGDASVLLGVRCRLSGFCLAVGAYRKGSSGSPILNQALRWNGRRWSVLPVPDPAGHGASSDNELNGLSCTSARDCWAVGFAGHGEGAAPILNQALHWNGRKWSAISTPNPGGRGASQFSVLNGDYCTSARNCWAAGFIGSAAAHDNLNQVLHWNGRRWATVSVPEPDGSGSGAINQLTSVTCTTAAFCWAVGFDGHASRVNQVLRWNGHRWRLVASPDPAGTANGNINELFGVRCASSALCFAVGEWQQVSNPVLYFTLLWNGRRWIVD